MRVTNRMMLSTYLTNLHSNAERLQKHYDQLSSGKAVKRPSDDPTAATKVMALRAQLEANAQYERNVDEAKNILQTVETAFSSATNIIHRAKELAVYGANDSLSSSDREAISFEVQGLLEQLVTVANASVGERYVFAGKKVRTKPFELTAGTVVYNGTNSAPQCEINPGVPVSLGVPGNEAFTVATTGQSVFDILAALRDSLASNQLDQIDAQIGDLDEALDSVLRYRAEVGARQNYLEGTSEKIKDSEINLTTLLSKAGDIDVAESVMNAKMLEMVYNASLATGARLLQPTLLDYLR